MPAKRIELVGQQFGFLTVKSFVGMAKRHALYAADCMCGRKGVLVRSTDLISCKIRKCSRACPYKPERIEFQAFRTIEDGSKL